MAKLVIPYDLIEGHELNLQAFTSKTDLGGGKIQRRLDSPVIARSWDIVFKKNPEVLAQLLAQWEENFGDFGSFEWDDPLGVERSVNWASNKLKAAIKFGYGNIKLSLVENLSADMTPPTVSSVSPANGANSGSLIANVVWVMSKAIMPSSVTATYFHVIDSTTGASVAGTLALSGAGTVVTFTPTAPWTSGRLYLPRAEAGVVDLSGNALAAAAGSKFTATAS